MIRSQDMAFTIAKLADAGGVGVETIRFYQRRGLLDVPKRNSGDGPTGGARRYGQDDVRRLRFIRSAKTAGFTLEEIAELLRLDAANDRARARDLASARILALDAKIAELQAARASLSRLSKACARQQGGPCPILDAFAGD
ncbi:MerR family transcriptional regulator [Rhizobium sp. G21]|uniref:MerR family transcriptional regulator n=1 Tax=Rhizobium sp. G21 TaxID=2758439 RepID=UPI001AED8A78|nr:MerR family DNA-binding protein [Rhizobium sp. G21]